MIQVMSFFPLTGMLVQEPRFTTDIQRSKRTAGFTFVETIVAIGVLGIFFAAIAFILQQVLQNIGESRVRTTALALAQQKMELIRNLPYNSIGTIGGIPQGSISPTEEVTINNQSFTVTTSIIYIDDPFDEEVPADLINTDYKRARIQVTWSGAYPSLTPVTFVTNIVPKGVETIVGGGTLYIRVFDSNGQAVSGASVKVDNTTIDPQIHMDTLTNSNGLVVLPGAPACVTCYQITVTKQNYSTDKTYSTSEVDNPTQPLATIIEGSLTQLSFAIDLVSNVTIYSYGSREAGFPPIAAVDFTLRGSKTIGYNTTDDPVYKYAFSTNTGGGVVNIPSLEWDTYTLDFTNSGHVLTGANPMSPFSLSAATSLTILMSAVPKGNTSLLVGVKDAAQQPQATASIQLSNSTFTYIATKSAGATGSADFGQAFFGNLTSTSYDIKVTLSGYQEATSSVTITTNQQEIMTLNLAP